jgi:hypothetical protein
VLKHRERQGQGRGTLRQRQPVECRDRDELDGRVEGAADLQQLRIALDGDDARGKFGEHAGHAAVASANVEGHGCGLLDAGKGKSLADEALLQVIANGQRNTKSCSAKS